MHTLYLILSSCDLLTVTGDLVAHFSTFGDAYDFALSHGFAVEVVS